MNCCELLAAALGQVAAGLPDSANHYFLGANYYDYVGGDKGRWWQAALWLNTETTRSFELGANELQLEVLLADQPRDHWALIRIPYAEIWDVMHQRTAGNPTPGSWGKSLYHSFATMRMPPVG